MPCSAVFDFSLAGDVFLSYNVGTGLPEAPEYAGGGMRIFPASGVADLLCLTINKSGAPLPLSEIYISQFAILEVVGYYHYFLFSFDNAETWNTYGASGWRRLKPLDLTVSGLAATAALMKSEGLSRAQLEQIHEWADMVQVRMLVLLSRETIGASGLLNDMGWCYGATVKALSTEPPDSGDVLGPLVVPINGYYLGLMPDYPFEEKIVQPIAETKAIGGYSQTVSMASRLRSVYENISWAGRSPDEMTAVAAFIRDHQDQAFKWTPQGLASGIQTIPQFFIATDIGIEHHGNTIRAAKATFIEVFP
jgi:hypothetical protein